MLNDFLVLVLAALMDVTMILAAHQYLGWWRYPARCLVGGIALAIMIWVVMDDGPTWALIALAIAHVGALYWLGQQVASPAPSKPKAQPKPRPAVQSQQSNVAASLGFKVQA